MTHEISLILDSLELEDRADEDGRVHLRVDPARSVRVGERVVLHTHDDCTFLADVLDTDEQRAELWLELV